MCNYYLEIRDFYTEMFHEFVSNVKISSKSFWLDNPEVEMVQTQNFGSFIDSSPIGPVVLKDWGDLLGFYRF